ncbi:MAG TPA: SDR family oxidoreductase [Chitinivibrionales bacterium]|nr:SDR family oxidoreductase [Chitinivibrionales bacterium]
MAITPLALITGATSGIGKSFAESLASQGYDLVITGRRRQILEKFAAELESHYGTSVKVVIADFGEKKDLDGLISLVKSLARIDILINNAGFGLKNAFAIESPENIGRMIQVHAAATVLMTHAALPRMIAAKKGVIINVSSLAAVLPLPGSEIYSATKSFLNGFSKSLSLSLRRQGIKVQALCPGFTRTDFHAKLDLAPAQLKNAGPVRWMSSDDVVAESLAALKKGKKIVVVPGFWNKALYLFIRFVPWGFYAWVVTTFFLRSDKNQVFKKRAVNKSNDSPPS